MDNYETAGYGGGEVGFGEQAAVLVVDFQLGFTDPSYPAGKSEHIHSAVLHTNNLLELAREKNIPVANCNVAWSGITDMGYWKVTSLYDGSFFKGHKSNLSHSSLNLSGSSGCSSGWEEISIFSYSISHLGISICIYPPAL